MTKKIVLCLLFFAVSPLFLFLALFFQMADQKQVLGDSISLSPQPAGAMVSPLEDVGVVAPTIIAQDSTPIMIENYLRHYQSPLVSYVDNFVEAGKRYHIKPQLVVAIAQQESNLGKNSPENCYNAWGWGIHSQGTTCFANWPEAIDAVTRGIAREYCAKGYCDDPCVMMEKYTPKSNGSWCAGVKQFLDELATGDF